MKIGRIGTAKRQIWHVWGCIWSISEGKGAIRGWCSMDRCRWGGERGIGHGTAGVHNRIRHQISDVLGGCLEEKFESLLIGWMG